ncbi:TetR/AcrR family transcriptional regulator [Scytonema sp. NUACC21]
MPKTVDCEQYRKKLLSKSFDLFAKKGYRSTTMREIAQFIGVSTGKLYHYFPSKQALFEQLVEEISQQDELKVTFDFDKHQTWEERLETFETFLVKQKESLIKRMYILIDFYRCQDSNEGLNSKISQQIIERSLLEIHDFLGIEDPVLASFTFSLINGLIIEHIRGNERVSIPEQCTLFKKILKAYLEQGISKNREKLIVH